MLTAMKNTRQGETAALRSDVDSLSRKVAAGMVDVCHYAQDCEHNTKARLDRTRATAENNREGTHYSYPYAFLVLYSHPCSLPPSLDSHTLLTSIHGLSQLSWILFNTTHLHR